MRPSLREFDVQNKIRQAQVFIKAKQFDDAEDLLNSLGTPDANRLLLRLQRYRLAIEINKTQLVPKVQAPEPKSMPRKRYAIIRVVNYGLFPIAFGWALWGIYQVINMTDSPFRIGGVSYSQIAGITVLGQAFFIFLAGLVVNMLIDMAENAVTTMNLLLEEIFTKE